MNENTHLGKHYRTFLLGSYSSPTTANYWYGVLSSNENAAKYYTRRIKAEWKTCRPFLGTEKNTAK